MVQWLKSHVAEYGGDPEAIFIIGHSAGGTHLSAYLYNAAVQPSGGPGIAGAILLSAAVGAEAKGPREEVARAYYGEDPAGWAAKAPLALAETYAGTPVPTFVITSEFDPSMIEAPAAALYAELCRKEQACPRYLQARGHNHLSTALSLGSADDSVGVEMRDFIATTLSRRTASR
jgi:triacylglycerol lipase